MHLIVGKVVEDGRDGRGAVLLKDARELRVHITRASLVHRRSRAPAAVKCRAQQLLLTGTRRLSHARAAHGHHA